MMKTRFFLFLLASFTISSCAVHSGNINNSQIPNTSKGIVYKDKVYGYASCYYILGIGGLGSQGLAAEAVFNLKNGVELEAGEYLDNFTIDHRRFYFVPFYVQHEVLVTADKILDLDQKKVSYDKEYINQNQNFEVKQNDFFNLSEKVTIRKSNGESKEATIIKHLEYSAKVLLMNKNGKLERKRVGYNKIYKKDAQGDISFFLTAKKGDTVSFNENNFGVFYNKKGVFLGSNNSNIFLKDLDSSITYVRDFSKIIIEDSTPKRRKILDDEVFRVLKISDQKVLGKINDNNIIHGELVRVEGNEVLVQLESSNEEVLLDLNNVYTIENWLEFSTQKPFKKILRVNQKVLYHPINNLESTPAVILGFRYHRVLIRTDDGKVLDVPIGKLNI